MAVDTKTKRLNMLQLARPFVVALPDPDGAFGPSNRAHLSQWYLVGLFPSDNPTVGWTVSSSSRLWSIGQTTSRVWIISGSHLWSVKS
jgi:hypothetical protein